MKQVTIDLDNEQLLRLKHLAAASNREVTDLVREIIQGFLITFDNKIDKELLLSSTDLLELSKAKQRRLDLLMSKSNEGDLTEAERAQLQALVRETQEITIENARRLVATKHKLESLKDAK